MSSEVGVRTVLAICYSLFTIHFLYGRRISWAAMAEATTRSPSPSESGRTASADGAACVCQGATAVGQPLEPVMIRSFGLAQPPAKAATAAKAHGSSARRRRCGRKGGRYIGDSGADSGGSVVDREEHEHG